MEYAAFGHCIIAWALGSIRLGAAFYVCPALSDSMIPGTARRVVILSFSFLTVPMLMPTVASYGTWESFPYWLLVPVILKEAILGFLLGFTASIPFWIAENIGNLIDNQRGATMGEVYSPLSGAQVSTIGIFFSQIVATIFFVSGAVFLFLAAVYGSYQLWPVFAQMPSLGADMPVTALGMLDGMLRTTVVISAPVVILMFLATVGLGFVNRTAPQLNVFFLSMPVKSALGIAMLVIYLPFVMDKLMYTSAAAILNPVMRLLHG